MSQFWELLDFLLELMGSIEIHMQRYFYFQVFEIMSITYMKIAIACFSCLDRSEKSKRRTKTVNNTNNPTWNQSFVYSPIRSSELDSRNLEVTVWDFDRFGANDFLGEVVIELQHSVITEVRKDICFYIQ